MDNLVRSPKEHIPLGVLKRDANGTSYVEVKYGKRREPIRFSTYIALWLESKIEPPKAS